MVDLDRTPPPRPESKPGRLNSQASPPPDTTSTGETAAGETTAALAAAELAARRRRWPFLMLGLVVGAAATYGVIEWLDRRDRASEDDLAEEVVELATAPVEQRDLLEEVEWTGTLSYGESTTVNGTGGTVTQAAPAATALDRGDVVFTVDEAPVVVMFGDRPLWRTVRDGDEGVDVAQIEANLVALGYDPDRTVSIDREFTSNTEAMVERWQEDIGQEVTGRVAPSDVVMLSGPSVVTSAATVGGPANGPVAVVSSRRLSTDLFTAIGGQVSQLAPVGTPIEHGTVLYQVDGVPVVALIDPDPATGPTDSLAEELTDPGYYHVVPAGRVVGGHLADADRTSAGGLVMSADASQLGVAVVVGVADADEFEVGQEVAIKLADESEVDGVVSDIGSVVESGQGNGGSTVTITIDVVGSSEDLVEGAATVTTVGESVIGATAVPTRSLVSLAEGGFAVEVVQGDGDSRLVAVELGSYDDGYVEIIGGELAPGDEVVVPQ